MRVEQEATEDGFGQSHGRGIEQGPRGTRGGLHSVNTAGDTLTWTEGGDDRDAGAGAGLPSSMPSNDCFARAAPPAPLPLLR